MATATIEKKEHHPTPEQWDLIVQIIPLMWRWARQWTPESLRDSDLEVAESYDVLMHKAILATRGYDPSRGFKFATYFGKHARWHVMNYWREKRLTASLDDIVCPSTGLRLVETIAAEERTEDDIHDTGHYLSILTERERLVVELRHGLNGASKMASNDIGQMLGFSGQYARMLYVSAHDKLIRRFASEGV